MIPGENAFLYRYIEYKSGLDEVSVIFEQYPILKTTPRGCWIYAFKKSGPGRRFVLGGSKKRFAYPTKKEALESFILRKRRHLSWLKFDIRNVEEAIPIAEEMLKNEDYDKYGDDYWS